MGEISDALKRAGSGKHGVDRAPVQESSRPESDGIARLLEQDRKTRSESLAKTTTADSLETAAAKLPIAKSPEPAPTAPFPELSSPHEDAVFDWSGSPSQDRISRIVAIAPESQAAVRFRHFAIRVRSDLSKRARSSLLVTSAVSGEGKTTVSINLALALASIAPESKIALVDLDLRRSRIARALGCKVAAGIDDAFAGRADLGDVRIRTSLENLDVYAVRQPSNAPHELLGASTTTELIHDLHNRYDYVIFDGPPVLPVPDVSLVEPQIGACLLVIRSRQSRHAALSEMMEILPRDAVLGVFLNDAIAKRDRNAYGYYGQYAAQNDEA